MKKQFLITFILIFFGFTTYSQPGTIDLTFNPGTGPSSVIKTTSIQSDGKIIIGGTFATYNGITINHIARLNTDGTLDATFNTGTGPGSPSASTVETTSIQSDGKIIIGGSFRTYNGISRNGIARLNPDGTLDTTFNTGTGTGINSNVGTTSIQSDGKIIIAGFINSYNGITINRIARLNTDGTLDTTFNPGTGPNNIIETTSIQSDGKIIIGGNFTVYNGIGRNFIARLNTDGTLDATFNGGTEADNIVRTASIQSDGKIIIGGDFNSYNGITRNQIARLNTNGTLDTNFNPGTGTEANSTVYDSSIQSDGKIIIVGAFNFYNSVTRNGIARLNTDGTLDDTFNPGTGTEASTIVRTTSIQSDGQLIIGGNFTSYNGTGRNRIARINGGSALSTNVFNENRMVIYPNPSKGVYTFITNELNITKSISIYTILGQKIYDTVISSNETTIDISNQPKGVYIYKVCGLEGETKSGKLVIE
jgi:uncharacterized delta-60 repeat protein